MTTFKESEVETFLRRLKRFVKFLSIMRTYLEEGEREAGLGPLVVVLREEEEAHALPEARAGVEGELGEGVQGVGQALGGEAREAGGGLKVGL